MTSSTICEREREHVEWIVCARQAPGVRHEIKEVSLTIQMRARPQRDKELRPIRVRPLVRHAKQTSGNRECSAAATRDTVCQFHEAANVRQGRKGWGRKPQAALYAL